MPDNNNAKVASSTKSSGIKPIVVIGVGCLILLFIVGTVILKTNLQDIEKGKVTFTDTKTGQTVKRDFYFSAR